MKKIVLIGILACALIAGAVFIFFAGNKEVTNVGEQEIVEVEVQAPAEPMREVPEGVKEYRNGRFGFSLLVPLNFTIEEKMETATSHSIVFENPEGVGFQIFVVAFAEQQISEERFKQDVPSGVRKNPQDISIGGVQAVAFESEVAAVGETQEVWFIKNGYLFEVTTYKPLAESLFTIMGTWMFIR